MLDKIMVKDDINFLEHPNWIVSKRDLQNKLTIKKEQGTYEIKSTEGLPVRFDKIILYYLLHKIFKESDLTSTEIVTTRYEIAKNVFLQKRNFSKTKYDRIMLALRKWKAIFIKFEGVFYEGDNYTIKYFSTLDYVSLDKKTKKLSIKFNDQYIKQLHETKYYNLIDFSEYKKLIRPVSTRLYEILTKSFSINKIWEVDIKVLAENLTLEKREYVSQILVAIKPAIDEINENTKFNIKFVFDKQTGICKFKNLKK